MQSYSARVVREGLAFGEAPRWHEGRLWFSDFYRHGIFSIDESGGDERLEHVVPGQPSGIGWLPDGDMVCVSMTDQRVLRFHDCETSLFCDIADYCGFWANDMVTSLRGVSYVGNFGFDLDTLLAEKGIEGLIAQPPPTTNLVVLDANGEVLQIVPNMAFPNGTVITPDGATLIVGETMASRLSAFDIEVDGTLTNRRVWAPLEFVAPDGMCLDAEGQIWLANALTNECVRVKEGGDITGIVTTTQTAFACALGGKKRTTLYVMCAPTSDRFTRARHAQGTIEIAEVNVAGAGVP